MRRIGHPRTGRQLRYADGVGTVKMIWLPARRAMLRDGTETRGVVDEKLIVEAKSAQTLPACAARQLYNYLRATNLAIGLLLHFGPEPKFHRLISPRALQKQGGTRLIRSIRADPISPTRRTRGSRSLAATRARRWTVFVMNTNSASYHSSWGGAERGHFDTVPVPDKYLKVLVVEVSVVIRCSRSIRVPPYPQLSQ